MSRHTKLVPYHRAHAAWLVAAVRCKERYADALAPIPDIVVGAFRFADNMALDVRKWDGLALMREAVDRGEFDSLSEVGRAALKTWAEEYEIRRGSRRTWAPLWSDRRPS